MDRTPWVKTGNFPVRIVVGLGLSILSAASPASAQEAEEPSHEREELGINRYTAPRIEHVFEILDQLKPLPFAQLWRDLPAASPPGRERKGLIFGGLIADGFLIVTAQKPNLVDDLGRVLIREARGLGVADRVMRHSASLAELGRGGNWEAMRQELIATQADVERAMVDLRDEKMAALLSLGGWLRGLEIGAAAVEADFSPKRAALLAQPELLDYFVEELNTLPPPVAHTPPFDQLRAGLREIQSIFAKSGPSGWQIGQVRTIHERARGLNLTLRRNR